MRGIEPALVIALLLPGAARAQAIPFDEAERLVLARAGEAQAAEAAIEGAEAAARQAGALPNPSLSLSAENFGGGGAARSFDSAELTASLQQPLLTGGRRSARRGAAAQTVALAEADAGRVARALRAELLRRYAAAALSAERLRLAEERRGLVARLAADAARRLAAGDIAEVDARRFEVELARASATVSAARAEAEANSRALGLLLGLDRAEAAPAWLERLPEPLAPAPARADAPIWAAREAAARAEVRVQRSESAPTLSVTLGVRQLREVPATTAIAGVSIGVPLWNRNRGQIARAEAEARRTAFLNAAAERDAAQAQALARARLEGELKRLATLRADARPAAERALALAQRGYVAGALPYRDLADTIAALYDVQGQELASLAAIAEARAALLLVESGS